MLTLYRLILLEVGFKCQSMIGMWVGFLHINRLALALAGQQLT